MDTARVYTMLCQVLLGRQPEEAELSAIIAQYGATADDLNILGDVLLNSEEFFLRHRENFVSRQFPKATVVTARGPLGHQIHVDLRQLHLGLSMAGGHYEPLETAFILKHVKRGMSVLDVGANIGFFTTMFAGLVGDSGRVIAFEPVNDSFLKLSSAVRLNQQDAYVELHNVAAAASDGTCQLSYDVDSLNMGGISMQLLGSETQHRVTQKARTMRIDDVVGDRPVHFIKMDIEGAEGLALAGAARTMTANRPVILMEFNEAQLKQVSGMSARELFERVAELGFVGRKLIADGHSEVTSADDVGREAAQGRILNIAFLPS